MGEREEVIEEDENAKHLKYWKSQNYKQIVKNTVQAIVACCEKVPSSNVAHIWISGTTGDKKDTQDKLLRKTFLLEMKKMYGAGCSGTAFAGVDRHFSSVRDSVMRVFSTPNRTDYASWREGISVLTIEWKDFFEKHVFPLLFKSLFEESAPVHQRKRAKVAADTDDCSIYEIQGNELQQFFRFHKSVHTQMPVSLQDIDPEVINREDHSKHQVLDVGELNADMPDQSSHPWRHIVYFDATNLFPTQLQGEFASFLNEHVVHDYSERARDSVLLTPPNKTLSAVPIWSLSLLKRGDSTDVEPAWTDVISEPEYAPTRLHVTYESLHTFAQNKNTCEQAQSEMLKQVMSGVENTYTRLYDCVLRNDKVMDDVTPHIQRDVISILLSRQLPKEDHDQIKQKKYDFKKETRFRRTSKNAKFYAWTEPRVGTDVVGPKRQLAHMDVQDAAGGTVIISIHRQQAFDIYPDSVLGIQVLDRELVPIYEKAMKYYEEKLHSLWSKFNPGQSLACGKATFWSYIVDRRFQQRGVKPVWPRYTLMIDAGHGVFVTNRMLHGGAEHSGEAGYRIHIYLTEPGAMVADIGDPEVSTVVYDFRIDPCMFVLARYLRVEPSETINMTPK